MGLRTTNELVLYCKEVNNVYLHIIINNAFTLRTYYFYLTIMYSSPNSNIDTIANSISSHSSKPYLRVPITFDETESMHSEVCVLMHVDTHLPAIFISLRLTADYVKILSIAIPVSNS